MNTYFSVENDISARRLAPGWLVPNEHGDLRTHMRLTHGAAESEIVVKRSDGKKTKTKFCREYIRNIVVCSVIGRIMKVRKYAFFVPCSTLVGEIVEREAAPFFWLSMR